MKNIFERLAQLANELDEKGFKAEADSIDRIIAEAVNERKFDIFLKAKVGVKAQVYQSLGDMDEPPLASHVKADGVLMVRPVVNDQVDESKNLFHKNYSARNLAELKKQMAADAAALKQKYQPASYDEQIDFYPVK